MAEKLVPGDLFLRKTRESVSSLDSDKLAPISPEAGGEESSDSEGEQDDSSHKLIRKVSTSGQMRSKKSVKEGLLLKQTSSFQRWKRRYFKLRGRTLYYAKDAKSLIFDEVDLSDASVAETSTKNINNSFTVITPFRKLILCAENRKEMEDWISALKSVQKWEIHEATQFNMEHFSGMHNWYACSHARPTFCNVCREALPGVTSHGLSCEVCKFKAHKRCAVRATNNCKWTTLASIGTEIIEDEDGVHSACKELLGRRCPLGQYKVSIIPPTALNSIDSDGFWKATCPSTCSSPLLAFVNSKSGDNQGVKFLRKFKQFLNPAQVFDLMNGGPHLGLLAGSPLGCWHGEDLPALKEEENGDSNIQCQLGVLPLGTGNDLARVLGWGSLCDDDTQLLQILEKLERATTKMLDRFLCGTVNDFVAEVGRAYKKATENKQEAELMARKCAMLNEKLDSLVRELNEEAQAIVIPEGMVQATPADTKDREKGGSVNPSPVPRIFKSKEQLMLRANSLKKALRQIIEQAEKAVDEQNKQTQAYQGSMGPSKKDSSEELNKEEERLSSRRETVTSASSSIILDRPDTFGSLQFPEDPSALHFLEKCVMNNYFGIGLDAKISLEFNNKRDEHPKKCRHRRAWWDLPALHLDRGDIAVPCDGVPISLPSLQGIAVLNIPSYAGGINFWGGTKEDNNFGAPSFDDKKLEVVAVFGSIQMAVSRVINLQHHRIAQCRVVKITIRGDEGVPVQVDGEAWIQPPGIIKIQHKNRAQMLTRDRAFESTLKSWEDKQKGESYRAAARPRLSSQQSMEYLTEEESSLLQQVSQVAETLIARIHEAAKGHKAVEQELAHAVNTSSLALSEALSNKAAGTSELDSPQEEEALHGPLSVLGQELQRLLDIHWLGPIAHPIEEESTGGANKGSFKLRLNIPKPRKDKAQKQKTNSSLPADKWGSEEVAAWLEGLGLGEYRDIFVRHDIQGSELILLERRDLKDLGINKVGHMKRILQAIKELSNPP
nr:PREDICTED: diacylglycerol kinase delta-like [Opisthocomus hoazin]